MDKWAQKIVYKLMRNLVLAFDVPGGIDIQISNDVTMATLKSYLQEIERDFTVNTAKLKHITNHFIDELDKGTDRAVHMTNKS